MLKIIKCLRSDLVLSAITAICMVLVTGPVYAQEEEDEKEKDAIREVLVDCDKGQSVQKILLKFANDTKPLEITVRGICDNEPDEEVQIERNNVDLSGDDEVGATLPFVLIDGARLVGIGGNLILNGGMTVSAGHVEMGTETNLTVNGMILLTPQSLLRITTEESEDEEESLNGPSAGQAVFNGIVSVENHSLLEIQREVNDGTVIFNDEINLSLQSSLWMRDATAGNVVLGKDSHAFFGDNVLPKYGPGGNWIMCDRESRVWGDTSGGFTVFLDPDGMSCQGG
ncbi:MAG: hypothetical protein OEV07_02495 [Gammaproteobacteria bacterium]|nr:hypothetical protein [Gammaproteobacteria bacterium]